MILSLREGRSPAREPDRPVDLLDFGAFCSLSYDFVLGKLIPVKMNFHPWHAFDTNYRFGVSLSGLRINMV